MRLRHAAVVVGGLALGAMSGTAQAAPVTYVIYGQISGSLDGVDFTLGSFSLSLRSDTATVFQPQPTFRPTLFNSGPATLQFTINGITGTFGTLFNAFSFTDQRIPGRALVGFTEVDPPFGGNDIIDVRDPALAGYDLRSAVSTVTNSPIDFLNFDTPFQTSAGELVFSSDDNASARFSSTISPVPLPASAPMLGAAILALGLAGYGVKRKKAAVVA